jgi:hypothetical protein
MVSGPIPGLPNVDFGVLMIIMAVFGVVLAWFIGRWADPVYKCKTMRKWFKKPYYIFNIIDKDGRTIDTKVVNAEKDVVVRDNNMWIIMKNRVYRKDKPESGFSISKNMIRWEEGAPTVYVDSDTLKILDFQRDEPASGVKSEEVGSTILAYIYNKIAKAMMGVDQFKMLQYLVIVLILGSLAVSWQTMQSVGKVDEKVTALNARLNEENPMFNSNGTGGVIIKQQPPSSSNTGNRNG